MSDILLVLTNVPDAAVARDLAQKLVNAGVAACVNQLAPCFSTYRWEGVLESATEVPLLIKTTRAAYPQLEAMICAEHPYQLPEIIALPITTGLPAYLAWVEQQTKE